MKRPVLIIIPGLGDRSWLYRAAAPLWYILGFDVRIFIFGWNDKRSSYRVKMRHLLAYIDTATEPLYIIGASAGGVAAVNVLYNRPHKIRHLITVATPHKTVLSLDNTILNAAQEEASMLIRHDRTLIASRATSFCGLYDRKVPIEKSKVSNVREVQLPLVGHGAILFCSLTFYSMRVKKVLLGREDKEV